MKVAVQRHHQVNIACGYGVPRPRYNLAQKPDIGVTGAFSGQACAIALIDCAHLNEIQDFSQDQGAYDRASARNDFDHSLDAKAIQRLMNRRTANPDERRNSSFVYVGTRLELARNDAMLDVFICGVAHGFSGRVGGARNATLSASTSLLRHLSHKEIPRRLLIASTVAPGIVAEAINQSS